MNENDTVVVIGGSSGLGLAVARRCLADGARVVIAGRSQQRLDAASKELGYPARLTVAAQLAAPRMTAPGSITFTSGIAAYRPAPGGMLAATVNGALESMVRALALELGPVRVNAVSPGWVDTPVWNQLASPEVKQARLADMAARPPPASRNPDPLKAEKIDHTIRSPGAQLGWGTMRI
jgi:NAD(P)-dependent dehydrogenase (short-subunit alcohol dehydrogenase family)